MTDLVIRSVHGRAVMEKDFFPFKPHEKPLHAELRRIELTDDESGLSIGELAQAFEFNALVHQ